MTTHDNADYDKPWLAMPKQPQRQDSTQEQLNELRLVAINGAYDKLAKAIQPHLHSAFVAGQSGYPQVKGAERDVVLVVRRWLKDEFAIVIDANGSEKP